MGRRKERRLAAMGAAGRRVKLDLFAEPTGDLGGSSAQNEVGGDDDGTKNQAGLPNSPSTSGKQRENPLVLLGQYSDDELDEGSSGEQVPAFSGDTSVIVDDQEKLNAAQENDEDFGFKEGNGPGAQKDEHLEVENPLQSLDSFQKTEIDGPTYNHAADSGVMPEGIVLKEQASDMQAVGDVILGWKVVFHEETNTYYYWNTATGETSWEVPDVLAQTTESTDGKKDAADTGEKESAADTPMLTTQSTEINSNAYKPSMEVLNEDSKSEMLNETKGNADLEQNQLKSSCPSNGAQNHVTSPGSNLFSCKSTGVCDEIANGVESMMYETGAELASSLLKRCEHLLEQLNSVTGSNSNLQGYNQILKYVLEVETRLEDMKSLASYGSSLLPFWLHSERRLQKLEIDICDILRGLESEQFKDVSAGHESHENVCNVSGTNPGEKNAVSSSSGDSEAPDCTGIAKLQKNDREVYSRGVSGTEFVSSDGCLSTYSDINVGGKGEVDGTAGHHEATPKSLHHSVEEIDMDIDMEVEDSTPTSSSTIADQSGAQHYIPSVGQESASGGEFSGVPPPPEDDWIPPPPPDNEPFPPPPPDEPPEIPYSQPSDLASVQSFSYAEQYMSYTGPNYGYYAQANTDLPSSNLYCTAEACQPTLSHSAMYFEAVPGGYGPATLSVNPVETSVYYTLQDGMSQVPVVPSVSHSSTVPKTSISETVAPLHTQVEVVSSSALPKNVNVPAIDGEPKKASLEIQSSQAYPHDLTTISVTESGSLPSVPAATASVAPATAKSQSKVRNKKRSVATISSLKSNKKVSSLVDKWKAAKEELQEEDEEPKNAYEILEKKRQREIEEWHAQQIASGGAKENANFQPLGGDWRERVKRKRAQLASESLRTPSDTLAEGNQQPDLDEHTRGLPNGWQAYWDDSSKQVYYGNTITSETTWIRPTS